MGQRSLSGSKVARKGLREAQDREKLQREVGLKTEAENREGLDSRQREAGSRQKVGPITERGVTQLVRLDPEAGSRQREAGSKTERGWTQDVQITVS